MIHTYIAKTFFGLEELLAEELKSFGGKKIQILNRAVQFDADNECLYRTHLWSAFALRVLRPFTEFEAFNTDDLYHHAMQVKWDDFFSLKETFKIDSVVFSEDFPHSMYAGRKVKDAVCDWFRDHYDNLRPNVEVKNPDYLFSLNIRRNQVQLSLDASGHSLHKRGYRTESNEAPINELLAAAMLKMSEWDHNTPLLDGMCGSGTIVIEALLNANDLARGNEREHYAFMNWKDFDRKLWRKLKNEVKERAKTSEYPNIKGIDINNESYRIAKENMVRARLRPIHHLEEGDFFKYVPKEKEGTIIMNPPYDERMQMEDINEFYERIGDHLKQNFQGWTAWLISSNMEALKHVGLRTSKKIKLYNGRLECRFVKFELY